MSNHPYQMETDQNKRPSRFSTVETKTRFSDLPQPPRLPFNPNEMMNTEMNEFLPPPPMPINENMHQFENMHANPHLIQYDQPYTDQWHEPHPIPPPIQPQFYTHSPAPNFQPPPMPQPAPIQQPQQIQPSNPNFCFVESLTMGEKI